MKNQTWIHNEKGGIIHIHNAPAPTPKCSEPYPVTINTRNSEMKAWLYETAEKIRNEETVDSKYGGSTLGAESLRLMQALIGDDHFERRHKILRYMDSVKALLDTLP